MSFHGYEKLNSGRIAKKTQREREGCERTRKQEKHTSSSLAVEREMQRINAIRFDL
jgi:hypothetical protein